MALQIVQPGQTRTRKTRTPSFPVVGKVKPYGLYPICVHPVLPGETLKGMSLKLRVLSMPVKNPLFGAWCEHWLVYVKLTDLDVDLAKMFITTDYPTTGFTAGASSDRYFTRSGQINYIQRAVEKVWSTYFANEDESLVTIDGVPKVKRRNYDWTHNLMFTPDALDPAQLPSNPEGVLTGLDIMAMAGMSELTYEKYLQQYGVSKKAAEAVSGNPEVLRYTQSWTQPTNTIEPTTGAPSSCWAWSDTITADKPRRFDEPGFLIVLQAVRPKMLNAKLRYSFVGNLWGFSDFFPAYNLEDPAAGIKEIQSNDAVFTGLRAAGVADMLYDHRDLLSHGEAFVNSWSDNPYPIPMVSGMSAEDAATDENLRGQYPTTADIDGLFTGTTEASRCLYYEGIAQLEVAGHVKDTTL